MTYYDRPVLKEPVWILTVPAYFYSGAAGGAAAVLGAVAQRDPQLRGLAARCRWIAAVGGGAGTVLLIADLGRPARFLNMLRVFRPSSPMNVGSWVLAIASALASVSALTTRSRGWRGRVGDLAGTGAGLAGLPLAGYTGVLLATTAIPAWNGAQRGLPLLSLASGVAGAASLLEVMDLDGREAAVVRRYGVAGKAAELVAAAAVEREVGRVPVAAKPYHEGASAALWRASKAATAASLFLALASRRSRVVRVASGVTGTVGSLALRFALFQAGRASSRDPRATFEQQRSWS